MTTMGTAGMLGFCAVGGTLALLCFAGCAGDGGSQEQVDSVQSAIGEPTAGFPSPVERLGIMAINRARSDPATVKGAQSAAYPARPPVVWNYDLSRSARFQAISLERARVGVARRPSRTSELGVLTQGAVSAARPAPSPLCALR